MNPRRRMLCALPTVGVAVLAGCTSFSLNEAPRFEFFVIEDLHAPAGAAPVTPPGAYAAIWC